MQLTSEYIKAITFIVLRGGIFRIENDKYLESYDRLFTPVSANIAILNLEIRTQLINEIYATNI